MEIKRITSRQNPLIKKLYKLSNTPASYHQLNEVWLEGEHLCKAYLEKIGQPLAIICSESCYEKKIFEDLLKDFTNLTYVIDDPLFQHISSLQSVAGIGYVIEPTQRNTLTAKMPSVILDRLQDPGNVGSILRTAAAFGFSQIIALKGTCALWSPKVLRAGMGAHFSLRIIEHFATQDLSTIELPILTTSSHADYSLQKAKLPWPCAWVFGHEGQGVHEHIFAQSTHTVCIDQPGGEESLNAAIAASICMYESSKQNLV